MASIVPVLHFRALLGGMKEWILDTGSEVAGAIPAEVPEIVHVHH